MFEAVRRLLGGLSIDFVAAVSAICFLFSIMVNLSYFFIFDIDLFSSLTFGDFVNSAAKYILLFILVLGATLLLGLGFIVLAREGMERLRKRRARQSIEAGSQASNDGHNPEDVEPTTFVRPGKAVKSIGRTTADFSFAYWHAIKNALMIVIILYVLNFIWLFSMELFKFSSNILFDFLAALYLSYMSGAVSLLVTVFIVRLFKPKEQLDSMIGPLALVAVVGIPSLVGIVTFSASIAISDWRRIDESCDLQESTSIEIPSGCVVRVVEHGTIYVVRDPQPDGKDDELRLYFRIVDSNVQIEYGTLGPVPERWADMGLVSPTYEFAARVRDVPFDLARRLFGFLKGSVLDKGEV